MTDSEDSEKVQIGPRIKKHLIDEIRILAIRQNRRFTEMIEEGLADLLKKYRDKGKGK
ncbi:hypothetical protein W02_38220 [Nitrospira sp. KM1]|uniref:hypothetical protein n=1 Tax=Nitrospira sp. KM1 TaxID=1936990 RepID=UPI0013A73CD3|nr:hypothetical protein [Nitrospira sp. KM1]BCA56682.1 hypothetical protein W02_38220 [Nitrospira sp. KM1]